MSLNERGSTPVDILVSILIPVHDDLKGLDVTLQSLEDTGLIGNSSIEVVVCNDGGGRAISDLARAFGCREAVLDENAGSYAARNAGIRVSCGEVLAFLDADQRVIADWMEKGLAALREADYVGGSIVIELSADATPWHRANAAHGFPVAQYLAENHYAPTANLFVYRWVFERVGPFDDRLRSGGDYEFGYRVWKAGLRQAYAPEAVTFHPARGFDASLKKSKRTGCGYAQVQIAAFEKSPAHIATLALWQLALAPAAMVWHLLRCLWTARCSRWIDCMRSAILWKINKFVFNYSVLVAAWHVDRDRSEA